MPITLRPFTSWPARIRATRRRASSWPATASASPTPFHPAPRAERPGRPPCAVRPSDGLVRQNATEATQALVRPSEGELNLLRQQEEAVQRVVTVDTDAAGEVGSGVDHTLAALGRPVLGDRHLGRRRKTSGQSGRRLPGGEADG